MKLALNIAFIFIISSSFGQEWRDSVVVARESYANKEYLSALNYYTSIQKKTPEHIRLNDELAQSAYKAGNFELSEKLYQQNTASKKSIIDNASNEYNIGNTRMKRKDYEGAIEAYKNALRINPNDAKARYNLSQAIRQLNKNEENKQNQERENQQSQDKDKQEQKDTSDGSPDKLSQKTADRMLDKLMKEEAETKRKLRNGQGVNRSPKSGKDW